MAENKKKFVPLKSGGRKLASRGLLIMDGRLLFPSSRAWIGDQENGDGDGDGCLPSHVHQSGSFWLPGPGDAVVGSLPSMVPRQPPSSSSSTTLCVALQGAADGAKAAAASTVHTLAERRRRERINGHLSTLRRMVPNATKMDKASLLATVIQEIRVLERQARDVSRDSIVPLEMNHVSVECDQSNEQANMCTPLIRASICCDDRPALFSDITEAFHGLRLKALRADIVSVGGRVQSFFVLCRVSSDGNVCPSSFMETMKQVLGRVASIDEEGSTRISSKRRRFFQSHYSDMIPF